MNILVSRFSIESAALLIAYVSIFPDERKNCRIMSSDWSCRTLYHIFHNVSPVLDYKSPEEVLLSIEPMEELIPGLFASASKCSKLKKITENKFVEFAMCVNPQLFKLVEVSI